jgi:Flp pilus assembly protein TadD
MHTPHSDVAVRLPADPPAATPPDPDSLNALGLELAARGDPAAAAEAFARAVRLAPRFAQARHNLGVALGQLGDVDGAVDALRLALLVDPNYFEAHLTLAALLAAEGRTALAAEGYRAAVRLRPGSAEALSGLGLALTTAGRGAEAAVYLRQATRLKPDFAGAHNNLGLAEADAGRYDLAEAAFDRALRLDPLCAEAHANLGNTLKEQGRLAEALACYDVALWVRPGHAATCWNRSLALLQAGDFDRGWPAYEARWDRGDPGSRRPPLACPEWDGSPLGGRSVLLWCEQGLGDAVQFVRYAALLKRAGASRLTCWCPPPLTAVLATCPWLDAVAPEGVDPPTADLHVPIMSLPRLFGTTLDAVPAEVPYLRPDADRAAHWRATLAGRLAQVNAGDDCTHAPFTVGIAWQGNPHHRWDRHRSVPLAAFAPLAAVTGVRLVSLQRGPGTEQLRGGRGGAAGTTPAAVAAARVPVLDVLDPSADEPAAVADVVALTAVVDLVVTVDTLPAHLAGAVGADVWVALSTMVDWRWLLGRDDTPWYPTMRLFRQDRRGDWGPVFERIARCLGDRVRERGRA